MYEEDFERKPCGRVCVCVCGLVGDWSSSHHLPTTVPLSLPVLLSPGGAVAPQELLGVVDGLGDHIAVSEES